LKLRSASILLGLAGGLGQLAIAFMGDAIGGMSTTVLLLALDAVLALLGAAMVFRWTMTGLSFMAAAALGAAVALFSTTWLEIGVAALLIGAIAAASGSIRRQAARG
jgi:hypothetical protein